MKSLKKREIMEILIENLTNNIEINDETFNDIEKSIKTGLNHLGYGEDYEISITIIDEEEIKSLNLQYRGKDSVTDVLSFPLFEKNQIPRSGMLGDIVICEQRVLDQAKELGHSYQRELVYLTIHSLLHLLGYDHEVQSEKVEMRTKEKEIMKLLGIFK